MDKEKIIQKFGKDYYCDDFSFMMGIDVRFADHLAQRFKDYNVLETSGTRYSRRILAYCGRTIFMSASPSSS